MDKLHPLHTIYTSIYNYSGPDRTDITVKGNDPNGHFFAPTWKMVMDLKNGKLSEADYVSKYLNIINHVPIKEWDWFISVPERTLICFCDKNDFCHRNILTHYLTNKFPGRILYGGFRAP